MKFKLTKTCRKVTDDDIIGDLKRIAVKTGSKTVFAATYRETGRYAINTVIRHFGSWNKALEKAGLKITQRREIPLYELFFNLRRVWLMLGRQPMRKEVVKPRSEFHWKAYCRRFGSFTKALEAFTRFFNRRRKRKLKTPFIDINKTKSKHRTQRLVSLGLRHKILVRDGYKCVKCGDSPAYGNAVRLQIDHIIPYSKGGETVITNLQTLCEACNLGKGNR